MAVKILETHRLRLEELSREHLEDLHKLLSNKKVHRHFPSILDWEGSVKFLERIRGHYRDYGYSFWAVVRKQDESFIGICGVLKQMVEGVEETEVGYRINDEFWGNGYGTEAAKGCMEYARQVLKKGNIISLIVEANDQSIRVAEKNGLSYERDAVFRDRPHRVYRKIF